MPYSQIQAVVTTLKLDNYEEFRFNNQTHQLIFSSQEDGAPIEFFKSTQLGGCDIYIWESLKSRGEDFLRAALAHELAEIAIYDILFIKNKGDRSVTEKQSHLLALLYENKYEQENINESRREEFNIFRKELRDTR